MKRYSRKRYKKCHVLIYKNDLNSPIISMTKEHIANTLGISVKTLNRHLDKQSVYNTDEWCVYCNRDIIPTNRVFTGKKYEY